MLGKEVQHLRGGSHMGSSQCRVGEEKRRQGTVNIVLTENIPLLLNTLRGHTFGEHGERRWVIRWV